MGLFPWDEIFYKLGEKEERLNALYNTYSKLELEITSKGGTFNASVSNLQALTMRNMALLINLQLAKMTDVEFAQFLLDNFLAKQVAPKQKVVFQVLEGVFEAGGLWQLSSAVFRCGKYMKMEYAKRTVQSTDDDMESEDDTASDASSSSSESELSQRLLSDSETSSVTEESDAASDILLDEGADSLADVTPTFFETMGGIIADAAPAALSSAAATGAGIFLAVGLDAVIGAIAGAEETAEYESLIAKAQQQVILLQNYLSRINEQQTIVSSDITKQIVRLKSSLVQLQKLTGIAPGFDSSKTEDTDVTAWLGFSETAVQTYATITSVKTEFTNYCNKLELKKKVSVTLKEYQAWKDVYIASSALMDDQVQGFITYVAQYSDKMKAFESQLTQPAAPSGSGTAAPKA
jgi:hypothetical protein